MLLFVHTKKAAKVALLEVKNTECDHDDALNGWVVDETTNCRLCPKVHRQNSPQLQ